MRILIGVVLLLIAGFVGVVVLKEGERRSNAPVGPIPQASEAVVTISKGGAVDIESWIPRQGLTIVEFTADF